MFDLPHFTAFKIMTVDQFRPETKVGGPAPTTGHTSGNFLKFLEQRLLMCQEEERVSCCVLID